jgi:hypothetical protein
MRLLQMTARLFSVPVLVAALPAGCTSGSSQIDPARVVSVEEMQRQDLITVHVFGYKEATGEGGHRAPTTNGSFGSFKMAVCPSRSGTMSPQVCITSRSGVAMPFAPENSSRRPIHRGFRFPVRLSDVSKATPPQFPVAT